jgi:NhaP-type Na+/H+ or K+/H+ antiporter
MMTVLWYSLGMLAIGSAIGYLLDLMTARAWRREREKAAMAYLDKLEKAYGKAIHSKRS